VDEAGTWSSVREAVERCAVERGLEMKRTRRSGSFLR
jgi:hypothetical protein